MPTIPPWLNTNPSDFVKAMQMGASAGLEVAGLRQRGNLASAQLAQNAADREAAREESAARAAESIAFRRWEEEQQGRRAAAALAQQGQIAQAGINQRGLAAALRARDEQAKLAVTADRNRSLDASSAARLDLDKAKLAEQNRHWEAMEKTAADKLKRDLDLPPKLKILKSGSDVMGFNESTGEKIILHSAPIKDTTRITLGKPGDKGMVSGPIDDPRLRPWMGTNAPSLLTPIAPATNSPSGAVKRYVFDRETGKIEE